MIAEAADFASECEAAYVLMNLPDDANYSGETQFMGWTIN